MIHELHNLRAGYMQRIARTQAFRQGLIGLIVVRQSSRDLAYWHDGTQNRLDEVAEFKDDPLEEFDDCEHRGYPVIFPNLNAARAAAGRIKDGRVVLWVHPECNWGSLEDPVLAEFIG